MKEHRKIFTVLAISFLMTFSIGFFLPGLSEGCMIVHAEEKTMVMDSSWYIGHEDDQEYTFTKPEQLESLRCIVANLALEDGNKLSAPVSFEGKTIKLGNDLDFSGYLTASGTDFLFNGIGNNTNMFKGTFDGCGFSIKNVKHSATITKATPVRRGIFSFANNATIQNLNVTNINIQELQGAQGFTPWYPSDRAMSISAGEGVAGIVAVGENVTIMNCNVSGTLSNCNYRTGGVLGQAINCTVKNCTADMEIETDSTDDNWGRYSGGIVGRAFNSTIINCSFSGKIDGNIYSGGIAGAISGENSLITNCTVEKGTIISDHSSSNGFAGGIAGVSQSNIVGCANHANVTISAGNVSGLVAGDKGPYTYTNTQEFEIKNSYSDGKAQVGESTDCQIRATDSSAVYKNVAFLADNGKASPDGDVVGTTGFTAEQFKNRKAVDYLNGEEAPVWFQNVDYPDFAENMVAVTGITADDTVSVYIGKELALNASVTPVDATNPALIYKSDNEETVTVTADGKVTGVKVGKANITITALYDGSKKDCEVTVKDPDVEAAQAVIDAMKAIDPSKATLEELKAVQDAYNALTEDQKKLVDADADAAAAKKAIDEKAEELKKASEQSQSATVAVKKGTKFTVKSYKYTVTSDLKKNPTVSVTGYKDKKLKKISISDTVKYKNVTFKVTEIGKNAFKKQKKATSATIGKNVTTIGASAFAGAGKLKKITVKAAGLKKVGAKALKGINKKAVIKVPAKKLKVYKKLFKGKGQAKTVKIKK